MLIDVTAEVDHEDIPYLLVVIEQPGRISITLPLAIEEAIGLVSGLEACLQEIAEEG